MEKARGMWVVRIWVIVLVGVILLGFVLWGWLRPPQLKTVEVTKEVTKIVEKPVEKVVKETVVVEKVVTATPLPTPTGTATPASVAPMQGQVTVTATIPVTGGGSSPMATPTQVVTGAGAITGVASGDFRPGWNTVWYRSPFTRTTDSLSISGTGETFAEPGVLLDNTAAFDHMDTPVLVPEGGYAFIATGGMTLSHNGGQLVLFPQEKNIYLVFVRGLPDDGGPADLNQIVLASGYVRGTGIYSPMPSGAYISLGWTIQQIAASFSDPNCGGGCQQATVVVVDLATHTYRMWVVTNPKLPRQWVPVF